MSMIAEKLVDHGVKVKNAIEENMMPTIDEKFMDHNVKVRNAIQENMMKLEFKFNSKNKVLGELIKEINSDMEKYVPCATFVEYMQGAHEKDQLILFLHQGSVRGPW